jgi:predicted acyl esterase
LRPGFKLGSPRPASGAATPDCQPSLFKPESYDEYVSDPAKPVPYRARPSQPIGYDRRSPGPSGSSTTSASLRPHRRAHLHIDVLTQPVAIAASPSPTSFASTSGTDSDWVVKLIDVYPDEGRRTIRNMGGYQLDRHGHLPRPLSREPPRPKPSSRASRFPTASRCPTPNHVFLPGHRIMVQVQSSWFPLYDRNPQTFRSQHLLGQAGGLQESHAAHLSRTWRGQQH